MDVLSEYFPIEVNKIPFDVLYDEWKANREKFVLMMIDVFGSFPELISVSRRTFLLLYCYEKSFGDFSSGNWFHFDTNVWFDYQLEDDEMILYDDDGIMGVTKGMEKQLFDV